MGMRSQDIGLAAACPAFLAFVRQLLWGRDRNSLCGLCSKTPGSLSLMVSSGCVGHSENFLSMLKINLDNECPWEKENLLSPQPWRFQRFAEVLHRVDVSMTSVDAPPPPSFLNMAKQIEK